MATEFDDIAGIRETYAYDDNRGMRVVGKNKWKVSIFWGTGSYSRGRDLPKSNFTSRSVGEIVRDLVNAEVAVFDASGNMVEWEGIDSVVGYVPKDKIVSLVQLVMSFDVSAYPALDL